MRGKAQHSSQESHLGAHAHQLIETCGSHEDIDLRLLSSTQTLMQF